MGENEPIHSLSRLQRDSAEGGRTLNASESMTENNEMEIKLLALKIRGALLGKGYSLTRVAKLHGCSVTHISQVCRSQSVNAKIQKWIEETIGYWPWKDRGDHDQ